jgi:DeoR family transcriptional regulator of aga operon
MTTLSEQVDAPLTPAQAAIDDLAVLPAHIGRKRLERMRAILAQFTDLDAEVPLEAFAQVLEVSRSTIRRDLAQLAESGILDRTHGGARLASGRPESAALRPQPSAAAFDRQRQGAKEAIARKAAELVASNGPLAVAANGGSTTTHVVRALRPRDELTLVTNCLPLAVEAAQWPGARVIMTGGLVAARSLEASGALSETAFGSVHVTVAFLGADGVSAEGGATTHHFGEGRIGQTIAEHARRVILVADASKIGKVTLAPIVELAQVDDLITSQGADPAELDRIRSKGVQIHIV